MRKSIIWITTSLSLLVISYTGLWYWQCQKIVKMAPQTLHAIPNTTFQYDSISGTGFPFSLGIQLKNVKASYGIGIATLENPQTLSLSRNIFTSRYTLTSSGKTTVKILLGIRTYSFNDLKASYSHKNDTYTGNLTLTHLQDGPTPLMDEIDFSYEARGNFIKGTPKEIAQSFYDSVGVINLLNLKLVKDEGVLQGSGTLVLDEALNPVFSSSFNGKHFEKLGIPFLEGISPESKQIPLTIQGKEIILGPQKMENPFTINWDTLKLWH